MVDHQISLHDCRLAESNGAECGHLLGLQCPARPAEEFEDAEQGSCSKTVVDNENEEEEAGLLQKAQALDSSELRKSCIRTN